MKKFPDPAEDELPGGVSGGWTFVLVAGVSTATTPVSSGELVDSTQEESELVDATLPRALSPLSDECDPELSLIMVFNK